MSRSFAVTEPHPTVPKTGGYIGGGRGGAGNFKRYQPEEISNGQTATGPASRITLSRPARRTVPAGRGGAGNMVHQTSEEPMFQFDEEMIKSRQQTQTPVYRIGRGGAGNLFADSKPVSSLRKDSSDSSASESERPSHARRNSGMLSIFSRRS